MPLMINQTSVLARHGWSKGVLAKLLGEPDLRKKVHGRTNLSALYLETRVVSAENSDAFKALQASLSARKASASKAVLTKTNKLLAAVALMRVDVVLMPLRDVQRLAIDSYNEWHADAGGFASHKSESAFLNRISVNFIRHELTEYDHDLEDVAGKTGVSQAVDSIRLNVYGAMGIAYPFYAVECRRQCFARQDRNL